MRKVHLAVGVITVGAFLASGQFMRMHSPPMAAVEDGVRMLYRSRHIYILASGLINLILGLYLNGRSARWRKSTQAVGSVLLVLAPALLMLAFLNEPSRGLHADLWQASIGLFTLFGGSMLHAIAGIGKSTKRLETKAADAMKVQAIVLVAVAVTWLASAPVAFAQRDSSLPKADFRGAKWGMTQAQVMATEPNPPSHLGDSGGQILMQYESKLGELNGRWIYMFARDKLVRAKFLALEEHRDQNEFIRDFRSAESLLKDRYGIPKDDRAIWEDDSTQQETKNYLDQDRATASSILPSDRLVGLAVALGHLRLYTIREDGRTKVLHVLAGANHHITHQIEYRAAALEKWEQDALRQVR